MKENLNILNFLKKDFFLKNNIFFKLKNRNIKIIENMVGFFLGSFYFSSSIILLNRDVRSRYKKKK